MHRHVFPLVVTLAAVQFIASSAVAQGTGGDYRYVSAVSVAKGSAVPAAPALPQSTSPPAMLFPPTVSGPSLGVQVNSRTTPMLEGTGSGGCMLGFGTMSLNLPAPPASGSLTYQVNFCYNYIITITDLSNNENPAPVKDSSSITGYVHGVVVVESTGLVSVQLVHIFNNMPTSNAITVTCIGGLGSTTYTLNFATCGLKTTQTFFPYYQEINAGMFGAYVTAVQF
jgi:hypothetical protein